MEIAIESVGLYARVAVSDVGRPLAELTWPTGRRHTPALVPMIDQACRAAGVERAAAVYPAGSVFGNPPGVSWSSVPGLNSKLQVYPFSAT